ncbi:hypothetical protein D3C76_1236290 [compost metagenome]
MARANSQIASDVRRWVGCKVSWFNQLKVPGVAMRRRIRRAKAVVPRAMKKIARATPSPGMAPTMPSNK